MGVFSYEKSQMFPVLCQLAQRDTVSAADDIDGGPPLPHAPLGAVLFGGCPPLWLRGADVDAAMTRLQR